jgi:NAD-dependent dihydropyrimidine dehydrogenase PreA subunit
MPGRNGTGPTGMGPMTPRAAGYYAGYQVPGYGFGRGRGRRMRRGMGKGAFPTIFTPHEGSSGKAQDVNSYIPVPTQEADVLKVQAKEMKQQLKTINDRVAQTESDSVSHRRIAVVKRSKCTGCSICRSVCPASAVILNTAAAIDGEKCTGCGLCIAKCPQGAIVLQKKK